MALTFKHMDFEVSYYSKMGLTYGGEEIFKAYILADCFSFYGWNKKEGRNMAKILNALYEAIGDYGLDYVMESPHLIEKVYKDILYLATYCSKTEPDCQSLPIVKVCKAYEDNINNPDAP